MPAKPLEIVSFDRPPAPPPDVIGDEPLISAPAVARMLGISKSQVFRLAHAGELPFYRFGRAMRFSRSAILRAIEHQHWEDGYGQTTQGKP